MKHPAAQDALRYIKSRPKEVILSWLDAFGDSKTELDNRCGRALTKIIVRHDVEDIDILGLAYVMKQGECG